MNIRDLDVRSLYLLEVIHRTRSVSRAAEELGLSQPAVSHALRKLRALVGDPLFLRTATGVTPTPQAEQLAASAQRILALVADELGDQGTFDPVRIQRTFQLLMTDVGELTMMPRLLAHLRERAPGSDVRTLTMTPSRMVDALESGLADLAVGPFPELATTPGLRRTRLFRRGFLCLAAKDQRAIAAHGLTRETYLAEPHLVVRSSGRTEEVFERFLAENGYTRRVALTVPHMLCVPAVIREADLIATVPQSVGTFFSGYAGIRTFPVPFGGDVPTPMTTVTQYWSPRFENDPTNRWLRDLVSELFGEDRTAAPPGPEHLP